MTELAAAKEHVDVVFTDPPRAGCDARFLRSVLRLRPDRVVYVSCNPETLSRDLETLIAGGYRAEYAQPVDMFPQTKHVETVCLLHQQKRDFLSVSYEPKGADYLKKG